MSLTNEYVIHDISSTQRNHKHSVCFSTLNLLFAFIAIVVATDDDFLKIYSDWVSESDIELEISSFFSCIYVEIEIIIKYNLLYLVHCSFSIELQHQFKRFNESCIFYSLFFSLFIVEIILSTWCFTLKLSIVWHYLAFVRLAYFIYATALIFFFQIFFNDSSLTYTIYLLHTLHSKIYNYYVSSDR